jgi:hypothetical protein
MKFFLKILEFIVLGVGSMVLFAYSLNLLFRPGDIPALEGLAGIALLVVFWGLLGHKRITNIYRYFSGEFDE